MEFEEALVEARKGAIIAIEDAGWTEGIKMRGGYLIWVRSKEKFDINDYATFSYIWCVLHKAQKEKITTHQAVYEQDNKIHLGSTYNYKAVGSPPGGSLLGYITREEEYEEI